MARRQNVYRCPNCRTPRKDYTLFLAHVRQCQQDSCGCGGYPYKHRAKSPCCEQNALGLLAAAARAGESAEVLLDIAADAAFDHPGTSATDCPF